MTYLILFTPITDVMSIFRTLPPLLLSIQSVIVALDAGSRKIAD